MKIDWSTAEVEHHARNGFSLRVEVVDVGDAHVKAFEEVGPRFAAKADSEGRSIDYYKSGGHRWTVSVKGLDESDALGERRRLDDFAAEVNAIAAPHQAELDAKREAQQRERVERQQQAKDLTAQFRNGS